MQGHAVYGSRGVVVLATELSTAILEKALTVKKEQIIGPPIIARLYRKDAVAVGNTIVRRYFIPRFYFENCEDEKLSEEFKKLTKKDILTEHRVVMGERKLTLQQGQGAICDYLLRNDRTLLCLRAGLGKTFVAAEMIGRRGLRTLYIVPKVPLLEQVLGDLRGVFPSARIVQFTPKNMAALIANPPDVCVAVINSALKITREFAMLFSFVILDEVHMYCSEKRSDIFWMVNANCMLAMTATPDERQDELDEIYHAHFGPTIDAEDIEDFASDSVKFDCDVSVIKYHGPPEFTQKLVHETTGYVFIPYMIRQLHSDETRRGIVLDNIVRLYADGHNIFVFCEYLEIVRELAALVALRTNDEVHVEDNDEIFRNDISLFVGGIKKADMANARDNARILMSTYGFAGTGISICRMTAIVFVTPRKSGMKQILGRILRRGGDTSIRRQIVDIVDARTSLAKQFYSRRAAYEFYGMNIIKSEVKK